MADVNQKREDLKKVYPNSKKWASKVDKMPEDQVVAIYLRFQAQKKL